MDDFLPPKKNELDIFNNKPKDTSTDVDDIFGSST